MEPTTKVELCDLPITNYRPVILLQRLSMPEDTGTMNGKFKFISEELQGSKHCRHSRTDDRSAPNSSWRA